MTYYIKKKLERDQLLGNHNLFSFGFHFIFSNAFSFFKEGQLVEKEMTTVLGRELN